MKRNKDVGKRWNGAAWAGINSCPTPRTRCSRRHRPRACVCEFAAFWGDQFGRSGQVPKPPKTVVGDTSAATPIDAKGRFSSAATGCEGLWLGVLWDAWGWSGVALGTACSPLLFPHAVAHLPCNYST